jgi:hypothetical protein
MSKLVALAAYYVKIWNEIEREYETLSDFDGQDALKFLSKEFHKLMKGKVHDQQLNQVMSVSKLETNGRTLSGTIETGEYGYESNLYDTQTQTVVHKRRQKEADMWPFYFFVEVPEGTDEGLLILQRTGNMGIRKVVSRVLKDSFTIQFPEFHLHFLPSVEAGEIEKYIKGKIQEVRFIKMRPPTDKADAFDHGHQEFPVRLELSIRAKRGGSLRMGNFLNRVFGEREFPGQFALDEEQSFEYDDVKARTKVGNSTRTIRASDPGRLRSYYDVTDQVKIGHGGHPTYESMHAQALKHAEIIKAQLYGKGVKTE